jgi:uncharacterized protein YdeI (YjbR/CyaY-like superfamily)
MAKKSPQVDAYISRSPDFAKPILVHFRELVHAACPDVEESIKWRMPFFLHHGNLCMIAAFKHHCTIGFWHRSMKSIIQSEKSIPTWTRFTKVTALSDLPKDAVLKRLIKQAANLNESGQKPARIKPPKKPLIIPPYFTKVLTKNKKAAAAFEAFSPSHKREYVQWITEAKQEETRQRRIAKMLQQLEKGKSRNWKYEQS